MFMAQRFPRVPVQAPLVEPFHKETIWRIVFDAGSLIILLVSTILAHFVAKPFVRGFFCSDTSIQYPYRENTIPTYAAVILSIGLPLIWIWVTEFSKRFYFRLYAKPLFITRLELCGGRKWDLSPLIRNLYVLTVVFFYGYLVTWLLTEIAKNFVGGLRPHFIAECQPTFNCSQVTSLSEFNRYLEFGVDYTCQNTDESAVREARRSFFSGHTSSIFYGFAWLIMYIHLSWSWRHFGVVGHLFQIGIAVLAFYIGYSRITDFHHHPQDVLFGALTGSLVAFAAFKFILNWYQRKKRFLPYTLEKLNKPSASVRPVLQY